MRVASFVLFCSSALLAGCESTGNVVPDNGSDATNLESATGSNEIDASREEAPGRDSIDASREEAPGGDSIDAAPDVDREADHAPEGSGVLEGSTCPMPTNKATVDVSALSCVELTAKYAEAVISAQTCGCDGDCSVQVCSTFCCNCQAFINPGSDAYATVTAVQAAWMAGGCTTGICSRVICGAPSLVGCTAGGSDGGKACTTKLGT